MTGRLRVALVLQACVLACFLACLLAVPATAQVQVSVSLESDQAFVGQSVRLSITVTGADREIVPPTLPDLPGVEAFGAGQSQRFSYVNGQSRAEYSWSWSLVPRREGRVLIPSVTVTVDGKDYQTKARTLTVTRSTATPSTPPAAGDDKGDKDDKSVGQDVPDAFVTMRVDKDSVVVGEQVILTFGFYRYSRRSMFESPEYTAPRTEGFWREDLPPESHRREVIRSRRFEITEIRYALFPTRSGELEISEATVRLPDNAIGSFFRRDSRRRGPALLRTDAITVHVRPLPVPRPSDFSGTVAEALTLRSSIDRRQLDQGDALTWRIQLTGTGHIDAAEIPVPDPGPEFTIHESTSGSQSGPDGGSLRGSRTVEYLVIPQQPGDLQLPALEYSWYDSSRQQYARARTQAIAIRVAPSEGAAQSLFTGGRKSEIELLARDILHIEPIQADQQAWGGPLVYRKGFWALACATPLAWAMSALVSRRRRALLADPRRRRAIKARAKARARLDASGPVDERVSAALDGYLADRFDRAASGLVRDEIVQILTAESVPAELVARTRELLDHCDALRFAPSTGAAESLLADARELIDRLEAVLDA